MTLSNAAARLCLHAMMSDTYHPPANGTIASTDWSAVLSLAFGVACTIAAELLPVSLLMPMARGLAISEGLVGQAVSVVALTAIVSSLLVTTVTRGIDRRTVLLVFSVVQIVSCVIVAAAPTFTVVIIGRVILGLAVGGFWAMSASLAMRLSRLADVPIALYIVFGGLSASMIIAAPAASLLEVSVGWKGIFYIAATLGIPCLVWQWLALPPMPPFSRGNKVGDVFAILRRPRIAPAMVAMSTAYAGHFAVYNFIRPLFELRGGLSASGISLALVIVGIANFAGTSLSAALLKRSLKFTLAVGPFTMAVSAIGLLLLAGNHPVAMSITAIWGAAMGCLPVTWSTWITRNLGDDAENAGDFQVALIQLSNVVGTAFAGAAFNFAGIVRSNDPGHASARHSCRHRDRLRTSPYAPAGIKTALFVARRGIQPPVAALRGLRGLFFFSGTSSAKGVMVAESRAASS